MQRMSRAELIEAQTDEELRRWLADAWRSFRHYRQDAKDFGQCRGRYCGWNEARAREARQHARAYVPTLRQLTAACRARGIA